MHNSAQQLLPSPVLFSPSFFPSLLPLSSPVVGVELLISTAMNTLPKNGEEKTVCETILVSSADSPWRLAEDCQLEEAQEVKKRSSSVYMGNNTPTLKWI